MPFFAAWLALGLWGVLIKYECYLERGWKQHPMMWVADCILNAEMGPIGLFACWVAYGRPR